MSHRLEDNTLGAVTGACDNSSTANQTGCEIIYDITIQVWHYHDVKLVRIGDHLHRAIIDDHRFKHNPVLSKIIYM